MSEALDWNHGVFQGAALKSEATAAAEHKGKVKFRTNLCKSVVTTIKAVIQTPGGASL